MAADSECLCLVLIFVLALTTEFSGQLQNIGILFDPALLTDHHGSKIEPSSSGKFQYADVSE